MRTFVGIADARGGTRRFPMRGLVLVSGLMAAGWMWHTSISVDRPPTSEFTVEMSPRSVIESDNQGIFTWVLTPDIEFVVGNNTKQARALDLRFNISGPPGCSTVGLLSVRHGGQETKFAVRDSVSVPVSVRVIVSSEAVSRVLVTVSGEPCQLSIGDARIAFVRIGSWNVRPSNQ